MIGRPVAELDGSTAPVQVVTLKELQGTGFYPPGPPMSVRNVWLSYPGRRHAVTAASHTLMFHHDEDLAWGIAVWLSMAVDPSEPDVIGGPVSPADRVPLIVDGAELETSYFGTGTGLVCRAALAGRTYYAAICPSGAGGTRLVTR